MPSTAVCTPLKITAFRTGRLKIRPAVFRVPNLCDLVRKGAAARNRPLKLWPPIAFLSEARLDVRCKKERAARSDNRAARVFHASLAEARHVSNHPGTEGGRVRVHSTR